MENIWFFLEAIKTMDTQSKQVFNLKFKLNFQVELFDFDFKEKFWVKYIFQK